jgi:hypothetical protein
MARQRLKYRIEWKEGNKTRVEEGWTWVGESFPFKITKKIGPFKASIVGKISTELEPVGS